MNKPQRKNFDDDFDKMWKATGFAIMAISLVSLVIFCVLIFVIVHFLGKVW